ncbi:hypothetical protein H6F67_26930 [Microcoleus sp. FACHB-1515]|uniref:hypothetical protein n=1 Tax=Cyanophyceae TaxID=3028117 RepID=UPI001684F971|nr:hypothetical protein [Microcoleus sp. FACHB-1515]MBD2093476.1 hypothetical protein [Microcoleus sp. FACHB-1515]
MPLPALNLMQGAVAPTPQLQLQVQLEIETKTFRHCLGSEIEGYDEGANHIEKKRNYWISGARSYDF